MKSKIALILILCAGVSAYAADKSTETFSDAEANFKLAMQKVMSKYVDSKLSKDELYRAATAGMLSSLNSNDETANKLLSPDDVKEMQEDLAGKISGIGAALKSDADSGHALVLKVMPHTPAEAADLKSGDRILSVDGKSFKGKPFKDLVDAIRGDEGKTVHVKVLRGDELLNLKIKREIISWTPVENWPVNATTRILEIGYFTKETPNLVAKQLKKINDDHIKKLILDLRDSAGGGFDQAIQVAEMFLPKGDVIASTKNRDGKIETFQSKGGLLNSDVQIVILANKGTFCGAELLAASIHENRHAKIVGQATFGKWNAQMVEMLPNQFAIKYTVSEFRSPQGNSYQGKGLTPDIDVMVPKDTDVHYISTKYDLEHRLELDAQLKVALEFAKTI